MLKWTFLRACVRACVDLCAWDGPFLNPSTWPPQEPEKEHRGGAPRRSPEKEPGGACGVGGGGDGSSRVQLHCLTRGPHIEHSLLLELRIDRRKKYKRIYRLLPGSCDRETYIYLYTQCLRYLIDNTIRRSARVLTAVSQQHSAISAHALACSHSWEHVCVRECECGCVAV